MFCGRAIVTVRHRHLVKIVAVVIGALAALSGCQTKQQWQSIDPAAIAAGREFLAVLETGEPARLEDYLATRTDLLGPEELDAATRDSLYHGIWKRRNKWAGKTHMAIIAEGDIQILGAAAPDGEVVTLFFVPGRYLQEAQPPEFYKYNAMKNFFACRFRKVEGRWQLWLNICHVSTDGPFPPDPV